jgi:hypothetical protein
MNNQDWLKPEEIKEIEMLRLPDEGGFNFEEFDLYKALINCRKMLAKHQWTAEHSCPECGGIESIEHVWVTGEEVNHFPDCQLAKLLPKGK